MPLPLRHWLTPPLIIAEDVSGEKNLDMLIYQAIPQAMIRRFGGIQVSTPESRARRNNGT
jgi:hypothetical protein